MNQEELSQVKQDIEKLVTDVKKLVSTDSASKNEDGKALSKCECCPQCGCHPHGRPVFWLGLCAAIGGVIGAMMYRKNHS